MSIISKCPRCHEQVTIPDGLDPLAEVRCPLCVAVYRLREALAEAPPALIPVDTGAIEGPGPDSDALAKSDLVSEPFHVPEADAASEPPKTEAEPPADEAPALDAWQKVDVPPQIDTRAVDQPSPTNASRRCPTDTGRPAVDTEEPAVFELAAPKDQYEPAGVGSSKRPRKKKEKSAVRVLAEVFLGGIGGLLIGYYVLCWALGPQHGLLELPLPLLPHTMNWFSSAEEPGNGAEQPPPGGPDTPKRQPEPQPQSPQTAPNENGLAQPDLPPVEPPPEEPE